MKKAMDVSAKRPHETAQTKQTQQVYFVLSLHCVMYNWVSMSDLKLCFYLFLSSRSFTLLL